MMFVDIRCKNKCSICCTIEVDIKRSNAGMDMVAKIPTNSSNRVVVSGGVKEVGLEGVESRYMSYGLHRPFPHHHTTANPQELRVVKKTTLDSCFLPRRE